MNVKARLPDLVAVCKHRWGARVFEVRDLTTNKRRSRISNIDGELVSDVNPVLSMFLCVTFRLLLRGDNEDYSYERSRSAVA